MNDPALQQEDLLSHLPRSHSVIFRSGAVIYDQQSSPQNLYLVESGRVILTHSDARHTIMSEICGEEDYFGEACLVSLAGERAEAFGDARVMLWPLAALYRLIHSNPDLGVTLAQASVRKTMLLKARLLDMACRDIRPRIALALLTLATGGDCDAATPDRIHAIPHRLLARYVGTTREIVTHTLNSFRRQNMIQYCRRYIEIDSNAIRRFLDHPES